MLSADDTVLINEIKDDINSKLEPWRDMLEPKGFRLSKSKSEYLKYYFSEQQGDIEDEVTIGDVAIPRVENFRYFNSFIQE